MIKAIAFALVAVLAVACKKKEEAKPAPAPAGEAKPTEPTAEAPKPADPAANPLLSIAIPYVKSTDASLVTGGQPSDEHLAMAKDKGIKTVVNLRSAGEEKEYATEAKKAEEMGMKYVHLPIDGKTGDGLNEENAKKLAEALQGGTPTLVHCATGQRVGALFALKAFYVDKKTPDEALAVGRANGLSKPELEKMVQDQMAAKKG